MTAVVETRPFLLDQADRLGNSVPGWWTALRESGRKAFAATGLPGEREEAWQFTSLKPLRRGTFSFNPSAPVPGALPDQVRLEPIEARLVFRNGGLDPGCSSPSAGGLTVDSLGRALISDPEVLREGLGSVARFDGDTPFPALNTAFLHEGSLVRAEGPVSATVHLVHILEGDTSPAIFPRTLILAGNGVRLIVIEEHLGGGGAAFSCPLTEIRVGSDAAVEHVLVQSQGPRTAHLGAVFARIERGGRLASRSLALGSRLGRTDVDVVLAGEGAEVDLDGLYVTDGRSLVDHHTRIDHVAPHTLSREFYKGVLSGKSRGVFNGKVIVRPGAQKIEASQANHNLLLSDDALVQTNPELEIFADDVVARHGATIGQLEDDHLFYLRSRGIPEEDARRLLIRGFVGEVLDRVGPEALRERVRADLEQRF